MTDDMTEQLCEEMHDRYEKAAAGAGWETNPASRKPWADVPEANKATMREAIGPIADRIAELEAEIVELSSPREQRIAKAQRQLTVAWVRYQDEIAAAFGDDNG